MKKQFFTEFQQWDRYLRSTERIFGSSWWSLGFSEKLLSYCLRYTCYTIM